MGGLQGVKLNILADVPDLGAAPHGLSSLNFVVSSRTALSISSFDPVLFTIRCGFVAGVFPCGGRAAGSWASRTAP